MSQGRREPWAYITVSNPRMPQRAFSPTYTLLSFSHHLSTLRIAKSEVMLLVPRRQKSFFLIRRVYLFTVFVWERVPPTLCVLINVTLTWTSHFASWRSRLMPAWFSPLPISERAGRRNEEYYSYSFFYIIFIYIYFYSNLSLAHTGSACSITNELSAFESFLESKMCDQSQIEAASIL